MTAPRDLGIPGAFFVYCLCMIKVVAFDLDGTLAHSKRPVSDVTAMMILKLLKRTQVAIITGGKLEQVTNQFLTKLSEQCVSFNFVPSSKLHLFTVSGARCDAATPIVVYGPRYDFRTDKVFEHQLPLDIRQDLISVLYRSVQWLFKELGEDPILCGDQVEDRNAQVTLSVLGQHAVLSDKIVWDPQAQKRQMLKAFIENELKKENLFYDVDVNIGGLTSIDITKKNVNKKFAISQLSKLANVSEEEIMFIGDGLKPGGNDHIITTTNALCIETISPDMTNLLIRSLFDL